MFSITVHHHAYVREKLGVESELLSFACAEQTAGAVLKAFIAAHPEFARLSHALKVAVGTEIVALDAPVTSGARVDLLPPYGGG